MDKSSCRRRIVCGTVALLAAMAIWLPVVHLFFAPDLEDYFADQRIAPKPNALAARHIKIWTDPLLKAQQINKMRANNAEWDFMGRTFFVLALTNMSLRDPKNKDKYLDIIDQIIDETIRLERQKGMFTFMMAYARAREFVLQPPRSLFIDGEIALMLGARRLVQEKQEYKRSLSKRIEIITERMQSSPVLSAESYPDECWIFCNCVALAAIRISDVLDGQDHSALIKQWIRIAKSKLTDDQTGLLLSSYSVAGDPRDGPEGSSIWMATHCLALVDRQFAEDQYARAKKQLAGGLLGFGYAREWPDSWTSGRDIDSGPVVPILKISPSSSALALIAARTFNDTGFLSQLLTTVRFTAFPIETDGILKYAASNQLGDAVLLYAMVLGPVWDKVAQAELEARQ